MWQAVSSHNSEIFLVYGAWHGVRDRYNGRMAIKIQQKAQFVRIATTDDQEETKLPFHVRLQRTREWLIEQDRMGDVCWKQTIKAIEETLTDMGVAFE